MSAIDETLPLPAQVETRLMAPEILVLRQVVPEWRDELIQIAEKIQRWQHSGQVNHSGDSYKNTFRSSRSFMISAQDPDYGPCLSRFEEALIRVFHSGVKAYMALNPFLHVTEDSGFEMLRYQEGERFGVHCDDILGKRGEYRQLSGLVYLNDGYEGGETYFPRQGLKFRATAGDLILFPSNFCYPHESTPVTKGTKYAVVTWFTTSGKLNQHSEVSNDGSEVEGDVGGDSAPADGGVCLHGSARGGSTAGEP